MYPIVFPSYDNSILNVTSSILKYYHVPTKTTSIKELDITLSKGYRNVIYILIDGLGMEQLRRHHLVSEALRNDVVKEITSVFPPTTVAATTAVLTGLAPIETGWLGWTQYIKEMDRSIIFFYNQDYYHPEDKVEDNIGETVCPVTRIYDLIKAENPDVKTREVFPFFREKNHTSFDKEVSTIIETIKEDGKHFIYAYWHILDSLMHEFGPGSVEVEQELKKIQKGYERLTSNIKDDSIIILIADHGQVDVCPIELRKYPKIWECFIHEPSIESRATAFFIKEEKKEEFKSLFYRYFKDYFILLTKEDVLSMNLFGYGNKNPRTDEFLGDFMGIAINHFYFKVDTSSFIMKGQHAGLLEEEMVVPLIVHSKK